MSCPLLMPPWMLPSVGTGVDASVVVVEYVVLLGAEEVHATEAFAILKSLHGIDAEHGSTQRGMQFAEDRLSQSDGTALHHTGDDSPDGVSLAFHTGNQSSISFAFSGSGQRTMFCSMRLKS